MDRRQFLKLGGATLGTGLLANNLLNPQQAGSVSAAGAIPTLDEKGWILFPYSGSHEGNSMWVGSKHAFRTANDIEDDKIHNEDNSLMAWAMSKPMYRWSCDQYGLALRNYLVGQCPDANMPLKPTSGQTIHLSGSGPAFYLGCKHVDNSWQLMTDENLEYPVYPGGYNSPYVPFKPSLGVVALTRVYPELFIGNQNQTAWLNAHIHRILAHQNEIVNKTPAYIDATDKRLRTASFAFHMLASIYWYQHTGSQTYLNYAKNAWNKIRQRQLSNGIFIEFGNSYAMLRHAQVLAAMIETWPFVGDYNGFSAAVINASNALKTYTNASGKLCDYNWYIFEGIYVGDDPCNENLQGGLFSSQHNKPFQTTIECGFVYLTQLVHQAPQAIKADAGMSAARRVVNTSGGTGHFYNTFAGNISSRVFTGRADGTAMWNEVNHVGGTLEANAMTWLAHWWQTQ